VRTRLWVRQLRYDIKQSATSLAIRVHLKKPGGPKHGPPFLRLPLELREDIYKYYVLEWSSARLEHWGRKDPGMPIPPHEPPITQVSGLIRSEALKVFYQTARFPLIIHLGNVCATPARPYAAVNWYEHLGPSKLCLIRHLELYLCWRNTTHARSRNPLVFNVDLEPDGNKVYWTYAQHLHLLFSVVDGEALITPYEEILIKKLLQKFRSVADTLGSAGLVSARDIYRFIE
jgi:hypothetical protein